MNNNSLFSKLPLADSLLKAVIELGYENMTQIQAQAIPTILANQDIMGIAQTGTGKTAAFSLPLIQKLLIHENNSLSPARHPVRALILLPTRELANQVAEQINLYTKYTKLRSSVIFGGMDMQAQTTELRKGTEILVATPGRLLDHLVAKNINLTQAEYVVLDEADRMLDIGFLPDLEKILSFLPTSKKRTTLLFSATFSNQIKKLAKSYLNNPTTIEVSRPNETAKNIEQRFYKTELEKKVFDLINIIRNEYIEQAFIFTNSRLNCIHLTRILLKNKFNVSALHGHKNQDERLETLESFKQGKFNFLVCTDIAARGLDIKDIPAVFNYEVPYSAEDYVHRIGRTGRAGSDGLAITLVDESEFKLIKEIEKLTKQKISLLNVPKYIFFNKRNSNYDPLFNKPYKESKVEEKPIIQTNYFSKKTNNKIKVPALFKAKIEY